MHKRWPSQQTCLDRRVRGEKSHGYFRHQPDVVGALHHQNQTRTRHSCVTRVPAASCIQCSDQGEPRASCLGRGSSTLGKETPCSVLQQLKTQGKGAVVTQ